MNLIININVNEIRAGEFQPRTRFDEEKLQELSESIRHDGLIQPVIVRKNDNGYELIAGERRYRACVMAGMDKIPAIVIMADDQKSARLALVENVQRVDLDPVEEAEAYARLLKLEGTTQNELAKKLGKSQSAVANKIRLLNLDEEIKDGLRDRKITERQGRALLTAPEEMRVSLYHKVMDLGLDSAGTEQYVKSRLEPKKKKEKGKDTIFLRDARIAVNSIRQTLKTIKQTNIKIEEESAESEDEYVMTIRIKKIKDMLK